MERWPEHGHALPEPGSGKWTPFTFMQSSATTKSPWKFQVPNWHNGERLHLCTWLRRLNSTKGPRHAETNSGWAWLQVKTCPNARRMLGNVTTTKNYHVDSESATTQMQLFFSEGKLKALEPMQSRCSSCRWLRRGYTNPKRGIANLLVLDKAQAALRIIQGVFLWRDQTNCFVCLNFAKPKVPYSLLQKDGLFPARTSNITIYHNCPLSFISLRWRSPCRTRTARKKHGAHSLDKSLTIPSQFSTKSAMPPA